MKKWLIGCLMALVMDCIKAAAKDAITNFLIS